MTIFAVIEIKLKLNTVSWRKLWMRAGGFKEGGADPHTR